MAAEPLNQFDFYLRFAKPLVLNLPEPNERVLAAAWLQKLRNPASGGEPLRTDYLKLLLFVLQRKRLAGPFTINPGHYEELEQFPAQFKLQDVARAVIEAEEEERKKKAGASGDYPPYTTEHSADLLEYTAAQDIPNFGVHVYYAISKEPLPLWKNADKGVFPRAVSAGKIDLTGAASGAVGSTSTLSVISKAISKTRSRSGSRSKSKTSVKKPPRGKTPPKAAPPAPPPAEEREAPTWGTNLIQVSDPPEPLSARLEKTLFDESLIDIEELSSAELSADLGYKAPSPYKSLDDSISYEVTPAKHPVPKKLDFDEDIANLTRRTEEQRDISYGKETLSRLTAMFQKEEEEAAAVTAAAAAAAVAAAAAAAAPPSKKAPVKKKVAKPPPVVRSTAASRGQTVKKEVSKTTTKKVGPKGSKTTTQKVTTTTRKEVPPPKAAPVRARPLQAPPSVVAPPPQRVPEVIDPELEQLTRLGLTAVDLEDINLADIEQELQVDTAGIDIMEQLEQHDKRIRDLSGEQAPFTPWSEAPSLPYRTPPVSPGFLIIDSYENIQETSVPELNTAFVDEEAAQYISPPHERPFSFQPPQFGTSPIPQEDLDMMNRWIEHFDREEAEAAAKKAVRKQIKAPSKRTMSTSRATTKKVSTKKTSQIKDGVQTTVKTKTTIEEPAIPRPTHPFSGSKIPPPRIVVPEEVRITRPPGSKLPIRSSLQKISSTITRIPPRMPHPQRVDEYTEAPSLPYRTPPLPPYSEAPSLPYRTPPLPDYADLSAPSLPYRTPPFPAGQAYQVIGEDDADLEEFKALEAEILLSESVMEFERLEAEIKAEELGLLQQQSGEAVAKQSRAVMDAYINQMEALYPPEEKRRETRISPPLIATGVGPSARVSKIPPPVRTSRIPPPSRISRIPPSSRISRIPPPGQIGIRPPSTQKGAKPAAKGIPSKITRPSTKKPKASPPRIKITSATPAAQQIIDDANQQMEKLDQLYKKYQLPERRPDVPRTPPLFSQHREIREAGADIVYPAEQFGLEEEEPFQSGEEFFRHRQKLSPFVDHRRPAAKPVPPVLSDWLAGETQPEDETLEIETIIPPTKTSPKKEIAEIMQEDIEVSPVWGRLPVTTPTRSPSPRRVLESTSPAGYKSPEIASVTPERRQQLKREREQLIPPVDQYGIPVMKLLQQEEQISPKTPEQQPIIITEEQYYTARQILDSADQPQIMEVTDYVEEVSAVTDDQQQTVDFTSIMQDLSPMVQPGSPQMNVVDVQEEGIQTESPPTPPYTQRILTPPLPHQATEVLDETETQLWQTPPQSPLSPPSPQLPHVEVEDTMEHTRLSDYHSIDETQFFDFPSPEPGDIVETEETEEVIETEILPEGDIRTALQQHEIPAEFHDRGRPSASPYMMIGKTRGKVIPSSRKYTPQPAKTPVIVEEEVPSDESLLSPVYYTPTGGIEIIDQEESVIFEASPAEVSGTSPPLQIDADYEIEGEQGPEWHPSPRQVTPKSKTIDFTHPDEEVYIRSALEKHDIPLQFFDRERPSASPYIRIGKTRAKVIPAVRKYTPQPAKTPVIVEEEVPSDESLPSPIYYTPTGEIEIIDHQESVVFETSPEEIQATLSSPGTTPPLQFDDDFEIGGEQGPDWHPSPRQLTPPKPKSPLPVMDPFIVDVAYAEYPDMREIPKTARKPRVSPIREGLEFEPASPGDPRAQTPTRARSPSPIKAQTRKTKKQRILKKRVIDFSQPDPDAEEEAPRYSPKGVLVPGLALPESADGGTIQMTYPEDLYGVELPIRYEIRPRVPTPIRQWEGSFQADLPSPMKPQDVQTTATQQTTEYDVQESPNLFSHSISFIEIKEERSMSPAKLYASHGEYDDIEDVQEDITSPEVYVGSSPEILVEEEILEEIVEDKPALTASPHVSRGPSPVSPLVSRGPSPVSPYVSRGPSPVPPAYVPISPPQEGTPEEARRKVDELQKIAQQQYEELYEESPRTPQKVITSNLEEEYLEEIMPAVSPPTPSGTTEAMRAMLNTLRGKQYIPPRSDRRPVSLYGYGERPAKVLERKSRPPSLPTVPDDKVEPSDDYFYWPGPYQPFVPLREVLSPHPLHPGHHRSPLYANEPPGSATKRRVSPTTPVRQDFQFVAPHAPGTAYEEPPALLVSESLIAVTPTSRYSRDRMMQSLSPAKSSPEAVGAQERAEEEQDALAKLMKVVEGQLAMLHSPQKPRIKTPEGPKGRSMKRARKRLFRDIPSEEPAPAVERQHPPQPQYIEVTELPEETVPDEFKTPPGMVPKRLVFSPSPQFEDTQPYALDDFEYNVVPASVFYLEDPEVSPIEFHAGTPPPAPPATPPYVSPELPFVTANQMEDSLYYDAFEYPQTPVRQPISPSEELPSPFLSYTPPATPSEVDRHLRRQLLMHDYGLGWERRQRPYQRPSVRVGERSHYPMDIRPAQPELESVEEISPEYLHLQTPEKRMTSPIQYQKIPSAAIPEFNIIPPTPITEQVERQIPSSSIPVRPSSPVRPTSPIRPSSPVRPKVPSPSWFSPPHSHGMVVSPVQPHLTTDSEEVEEMTPPYLFEEPEDERVTPPEQQFVFTQPINPEDNIMSYSPDLIESPRVYESPTRDRVPSPFLSYTPPGPRSPVFVDPELKRELQRHRYTTDWGRDNRVYQRPLVRAGDRRHVEMDQRIVEPDLEVIEEHHVPTPEFQRPLPRVSPVVEYSTPKRPKEYTVGRRRLEFDAPEMRLSPERPKMPQPRYGKWMTPPPSTSRAPQPILQRRPDYVSPPQYQLPPQFTPPRQRSPQPESPVTSPFPIPSAPSVDMEVVESQTTVIQPEEDYDVLPPFGGTGSPGPQDTSPIRWDLERSFIEDEMKGFKWMDM